MQIHNKLSEAKRTYKENDLGFFPGPQSIAQ
jgi:hypothetical protein